MDIADRLVVLHLSSQGRRALKGLVPRRASFEAFVVDTDSTGAWVLLGPGSSKPASPTVPVMLLKWDYISAIALEVRLGSESGGVSSSIGRQP